MPVFTPDFSDTFKPIEPGNYQARVTGYATGKSNTTGDMYIKWDLDLIGGEHDGRRFKHLTMLAGKGAGILRHFLGLCIAGYEEGPFDPQSIVGSRLTVTLGEEEYNGRTQIKIKNVSEAADGEMADRF